MQATLVGLIDNRAHYEQLLHACRAMSGKPEQHGKLLMHICVITYYYKVVVGGGTQLCTLLEVWVLRVGMSTLGHKRLCTPRIGDSQVPKTLDHDNVR